MKKLLSVLLIAALALLALSLPVSASGFAASGVTGVRLSSPQPFTNEVASSDAAALKQAEVFLASAGAASTIPGGASEIAKIELTTAAGTKSYALLSGGSGYYLSDGTQPRPVNYTDFELLVRAVDGAYDFVNPYLSSQKTVFYPYAPIPGAVYDNQVLAIFHNSYAFKRLNNRYAYRTTAFDMAVPEYFSADGKLITPTFSIKPEAVAYTVNKDGVETALWSGDQAGAAGQTLADGTYDVLVKANYAGEFYKGAVTYYYRLTVGDAGPIDFSVEAGHAAPGEMIVLRVTGADASAALATAVTDVDFTPTFYRESATSQIALLPVSVYSAPGAHKVTVTCGAHSKTLDFTVREKKFTEQQLTVSPSTAEETILSQKANAEYEAVVAPLRPVGDDTKRWKGRFILPTSDENVTSPFGIIRYVNGGTSPTRHNALDLAVPLGTPVKASGGGRVLFAGLLQLTGNTVIIEHGYGLKSWYYHMDSLNVKTGDIVPQGQQIGAVGSTGFSTGPHMHFGMSVNNVFVNPYTLIETDIAL